MSHLQVEPVPTDALIPYARPRSKERDSGPPEPSGAPFTPMRAIRAKCLDCSGGSTKEARLCPVTACALWPYRMGRRPRAAEIVAATCPISAPHAVSRASPANGCGPMRRRPPGLPDDRGTRDPSSRSRSVRRSHASGPPHPRRRPDRAGRVLDPTFGFVNAVLIGERCTIVCGALARGELRRSPQGAAPGDARVASGDQRREPPHRGLTSR